MLWKGAMKGSSDDCNTYRPVDLLPHFYKLLSLVLLEELTEDTDLY